MDNEDTRRQFISELWQRFSDLMASLPQLTQDAA